MNLQGVFTAATLVITTACSLPGPPQRDTYTGQDLVGDVDAEQIIGVWDVSPLNPLEGQAQQHTRIRYKQDGRVIGKLHWPDDDEDSLGEMTFGLKGFWHIDGENIEHTDVHMREVSGSKHGELISSIINNSQRGLVNRANVHELTADRMIMVGSDGVAMLYDRLQ
jgi:hypothetical protein